MDTNNCNNETSLDVDDVRVGIVKLDLDDDGPKVKRTDDVDDESDSEDDESLITDSPPDTRRTTKSCSGFESDVESSESSTTVCSDCSTEPLSQCSDPGIQYEPNWYIQEAQDLADEDSNASGTFVPFSEGDVATDATLNGFSDSESFGFDEDTCIEDEEDEEDSGDDTDVAEEDNEDNEAEDLDNVNDRNSPYDAGEELEEDNVVVICNNSDINYQALQSSEINYKDQREVAWEANAVPNMAYVPAVGQENENIDQHQNYGPEQNHGTVQEAQYQYHPVPNEALSTEECQGQEAPVQDEINSDMPTTEPCEKSEPEDVEVGEEKTTKTSWADLANMNDQEQMNDQETCGETPVMQEACQQPMVYPQYIQSYPMPQGYVINPEQGQTYQYIPYTQDGGQPQVFPGNEAQNQAGAVVSDSSLQSQGAPVNYYYSSDQNQAVQYVQYVPQESSVMQVNQQVEYEKKPPYGFTGGQETDYPIPVQHNVDINGMAAYNDRRCHLVCEQEPDFCDLQEKADELSYPYIYVSSAGLLTVLLRDSVAVEITLDHTIRVVNHKRGVVAATNALGNSSCVFQRGVRIMQDHTVTEASFYKRRRVYMTTAETFYAVGDLYYRMCGEDLYLTEEKGFTDLSRDLSVNILYSSRSYGPALIPKYMECAQGAQYTHHRNGGISVFINGVRIYQGVKNDVEVSHGQKFIRMSPRVGTLFLGTQWVDMAVESKGVVKVRRGGHFIYVSPEDFSVTAGSIECGLDRTCHAFIRPVEITRYPLNPNRFVNDPKNPKIRRRRRRQRHSQSAATPDNTDTSLTEMEESFDDSFELSRDEEVDYNDEGRGDNYDAESKENLYNTEEYCDQCINTCAQEVVDPCVSDQCENVDDTGAVYEQEAYQAEVPAEGQ